MYSAYFSPNAPRSASSSTFIRLTNAMKIGTSTTRIAAQFRSKSRNTPFDGWTLRGRPVTTVVGGREVVLP